MSALDGIWHVVSGVPRDVFGSLLNTGWGIAAFVCFTAVVITFLVSAFRSLGDYAKAWDSGWDESRLEADRNETQYRGDGYTINWRKARLEQAVILKFSAPFALLVLASMMCFMWFDFSWTGYWHVAVAWFVFAPLLRIWWVSTLRRASNSLRVNGLLQKHDYMIQGSTWAAFRFYIAWGVSKTQARAQQRFFRYRLRRLNGLFTFLRLDLVSMRLIKPLLWWLFYIAVWPVAMVTSVFVLTRNIMDDNRGFSLRPEWARRHSSPPSDGGLYTIYEDPDGLIA